VATDLRTRPIRDKCRPIGSERNYDALSLLDAGRRRADLRMTAVKVIVEMEPMPHREPRSL